MTARPLLEELRRKAADEIAAARGHASEEAEGIRRSAREAAERRAVAAREEHERAALREQSVACSDATRRVNERLLPARAAALDRIFARAHERLELRSRHPGLSDAIAAQVADALEYLPDGPTVVKCAPSVASVVRGAVARTGRAGTTVVEDPAVPLGVVAESGDGEITVAATFARRMARERAVLATEVIGRLGGAKP